MRDFKWAPPIMDRATWLDRTGEGAAAPLAQFPAAAGGEMMSDIPDDIQKIAEALFAPYGYLYDGPSAEDVATLIAAERDRCAKLCDEFEKENWGFTELVHAGQALAAAIRNPV